MRRVLGKGLAQLLGEAEENHLREIPLSSIAPNPKQPRKSFDESALNELAESLKSVGLLQPLVVRPLDKDRYELIAGERRWRAAQIAGLENVPVVIRAAENEQLLQLALIENLQREDIHILEAAEAYQVLISEGGLTQDEVAQLVGKSRPAIANALRLLKLPDKIRKSLLENEITEGHARAILSFETEIEMLSVHKKIIENNLSVREVERLNVKTPIQRWKKPKPNVSELSELERKLSEHFGSPVSISRSGLRGKLMIDFFNDEDLQRILDVIGLKD